MADMTNLRHKDWDTMTDDQKDVARDALKNWRSWGSWFSWGSPVGLGLWFIALGITAVLVRVALAGF